MSTMNRQESEPTTRRGALFGLIMSILPATLGAFFCLLMLFFLATSAETGIMDARQYAFKQWVDSYPFDILYKSGDSIVLIPLIGSLFLTLYALVKAGFINSVNVRVWRRVPGMFREPYRIVLFVVRVCLVTATLTAAVRFMEFVYNSVYGEFGSMYTNFLAEVYGPVDGNFALMSLVFGTLLLTSFTSTTVIYAFSAAGSWRRLASLMRVPLFTCASLALLAFSCTRFLDGLGRNTTLNDIPGYKDYSEQYVVVRTAETPEQYIYTTYRGAVLENVPALERCMKDEDARPLLRMLAANQLMEAYNDDMDVRAKLLLMGNLDRDLNWHEFSFWTPIFVLIASCDREYKEVFDRFMLDRVAYAEGRMAMKIGRVYAKYGQLDEAWKWYRQGLETYGDYGLENNELAKMAPPAEPPFNRGAVRGRVLLDGRPLEGARVAIKRFSESGVYSTSSNPYGMPEVSGYIVYSLTGGTKTDADGAFSLDGLVSERYELYIRLNPRPGYEYEVTAAPGVLTVDNENPSADAGTISLVTVKAKTLAERKAAVKAERDKEEQERKAQAKTGKKGKKKKKK